jgi:hypothetical protein
MSEIDNVPLDSVRINGGTQSRVELNQSAISEYAEAIRFGVDLPPVVTFFDGASFWLADGFHRYHAHRQAGAMEIAADIRTGTQRDAILFSVGANASHGLRRTNDDKRRAVMTLLNDSEWASWSDNQIAKACGVSHTFVGNVRSSLETVASETPAARTYTTKHGTPATMKTEQIGRARQVVAPVAPDLSKEAPTPEAIAPLETESQTEVASTAPTSEQEIKFAEQITELTEMLETLQANLKETLADNEMMGRVFDADDRIKAAMDEAKRQKAIAENAERTLAAKSGEFIERARAVTYWKNRAEKAEKKLTALEKSA